MRHVWNFIKVGVLSGCLLGVGSVSLFAQNSRGLLSLLRRGPKEISLPKIETDLPLPTTVFQRAHQARLKAMGGHGPLVRSTFRAVAKPSSTGFFSGSVIQMEDGEIFGVIAAHVAKNDLCNPLAQNFIAQVLTPEGWLSIPAEIVQISAPSMLDLALVKFRPEDEKLFEPLELADEKPSAGQFVLTQGFGQGHEIYLADRPLLATDTPFLLAKTPVPLDDRIGMCGSVITNLHHEVVGTYTGSVCSLSGDESFAAPVSFLRALVAAYRGENYTFPFILHGQTILSLDVDEYISEVRLADAFDRQQAYLRFPRKLSYSSLSRTILDKNPRYLNFIVRKVHWTGRKSRRFLEESREEFYDPYTVYTYDTQLRQVISAKNRIWWNHWF